MSIGVTASWMESMIRAGRIPMSCSILLAKVAWRPADVEPDCEMQE